jgi:hypothetical protein
MVLNPWQELTASLKMSSKIMVPQLSLTSYCGQIAMPTVDGILYPDKEQINTTGDMDKIFNGKTS